MNIDFGHQFGKFSLLVLLFLLLIFNNIHLDRLQNCLFHINIFWQEKGCVKKPFLIEIHVVFYVTLQFVFIDKLFVPSVFPLKRSENQR